MVAVGGLCGVVAGGEGGDRGSREEEGGGWGRKGSNVDGRMNLSGVQWGEGGTSSLLFWPENVGSTFMGFVRGLSAGEIEM